MSKAFFEKHAGKRCVMFHKSRYMFPTRLYPKTEQLLDGTTQFYAAARIVGWCRSHIMLCEFVFVQFDDPDDSSKVLETTFAMAPDSSNIIDETVAVPNGMNFPLNGKKLYSVWSVEEKNLTFDAAYLGQFGSNTEITQKIKKVTLDFPHKCLMCGSPAYIGLMKTECSSSACKNFKC